MTTIEAPTFGDRPKDDYWASCAKVLWQQVRAGFLPRMKGGERTIQAFMRGPLTTDIAVIRLDRTPETQALDPVIFDYEEVAPEDGSGRYWAVEARGDNRSWLMETGAPTEKKD